MLHLLLTLDFYCCTHGVWLRSRPLRGKQVAKSSRDSNCYKLWKLKPSLNMEQVKPIDYSCHLQLKESTTYRFASLFLFSLFYKAYTIFSRHPCLVKRMTFSVKRKIWRYPVKLLVPSPKRDRPPHWGLHPLLIKNGYLFKACETGPRVYHTYPRRLESLSKGL